MGPQCLQTTSKALYDYIKARDPPWDNCGTGRPPPPPPGP